MQKNTPPTECPHCDAPRQTTQQPECTIASCILAVLAGAGIVAVAVAVKITGINPPIATILFAAAALWGMRRLWRNSKPPPQDNDPQ